MGSPLDEVEKAIPRPLPRTSGVSVQTQRALIDLGEHPTITKLPVPAAVPAAPVGPGNIQGKSSAQVLQEFTGKTPEQLKAEQDARNRALFKARGLPYPPQ